jgi:hypothetical protein
VTLLAAALRYVATTGALAAILMSAAAVAAADATDDYPIPNRILRTSCTAKQLMAAARNMEPVYHARYMIDYNNKAPDLQQARPGPDPLVLLDGLRRTPPVFGEHRHQRVL